ncbi:MULTISPECIES: glutamine-hydrolyzing carbamoyl-phosphate synthase small subunit [Bartonella]|uniref:Carbamoyl phosphate synthase small chain n=1 Tax=Bartonella rochalimae ATCC BAA-1498 TaxID=685782 RepID=E6YKP5_9HYPH|nr:MULTISPECIES: glutamine-hydrolyzing carbamoyl-phosphate synthase small subunit [Bartonella]AQX18721.1 carbamoyl-phosphate synthase small subunit [Bartonella sp. A1379B]AQX23233.1 carbamoyl-phosphate synthase small subunit [Bartonella sp. 11B]AQX23464.1 carbamoyl-phosphate synthase small subunit [Bartonella sp. 114]AQX25691.1 carbamoyl-phosphate synthase small subunit [Bartonella sp. Coyote22sub2]KEC54150.1 carbamoyl-phosphate synthase small chain [Bartonella rochalimae ATCC BAA-1498]
MTQTISLPSPWSTNKPTALLVLADGTVIEGKGAGATGIVEAEVCFNTAITGYEEILTDPSYTGQIVNFTFPHIGNVGTNREDIEDLTPLNYHGAVGAIFKADITGPSNYRAHENLNQWLKERKIIALYDIDTRALTTLIREKGVPNAVIAHDPNGNFDINALKKRAQKWSGLINLDLAKEVTSKQLIEWNENPWIWNKGYSVNSKRNFHIVAIDYGIKRNILRLISALGAHITIVPASTNANEILSMNPDGIFLSNGPGDPIATAKYAVPTIKTFIDCNIPLFGICLGHQLLSLAVGAKTIKMHQGHHGANHPVKDFTTGKVEIVSMNHGFTVDKTSLPQHVEETHISLFDGSNCGIRIIEKPIFSVQYHPEASPGPQDSHYLFHHFRNLIMDYKK